MTVANNNIMICQINTTPRDFEGNLAKIIKGIEKAKAEPQHPVWVVFPEACIPGYLSQDLMYSDEFIENNLLCVQKVVEASKGCQSHIVIGYFDRSNKGTGKPFANKAAVICDGRIVGTYQKHLLPFYDVFDEGRYFEPGTELLVVKVGGVKWGICICEDVWNDKCGDDYTYVDNPIDRYRKLGIKNIISINSSPFVIGKPTRRIKMIQECSRDGGLQIIYCNQVGGQDELVFDGNSFIIGHNSDIIHVQHDIFEDSYETVNLRDNLHDKDAWYEFKGLKDILVVGLRDYVKKSGFKGVVLGLSGGIDSAVVAALAVEAIGAENVHCVRMPSVYSSDGSKTDALKLIQNFGCKDYLVTIEHEGLVRKINESTAIKNDKYNKVADENIQARLRGLTLMHLSNAHGWLLLTTGNKTESACGYCTLYGDMAGGYNPIKDLYKRQVFSLARDFNIQKEMIPVAIIEKPPSAELAPGQTDEASLLPYAVLDPIIEAYIEHYIGDFENFVRWAAEQEVAISAVAAWARGDRKLAEQNYKRIIRLCDIMEFKRRQSAPGIKVSRVAFGIGRRLPIVKK